MDRSPGRPDLAWRSRCAQSRSFEAAETSFAITSAGGLGRPQQLPHSPFRAKAAARGLRPKLKPD
eukprot:7385203-Prymnesium_polylepis.1